LIAYAQKHGYNIYDVYVDDGISGTTFDRPDFKRMINDIETGNVNLVLCKDLSRFGRDPEKCIYYRDKYFLLKGVEFITADGIYSSLQGGTGMEGMLDFFNEHHARETSRKVKAVRKNAAAQGKFMGSRPPYGYMRNPANRHALVIDDNVGAVVQRIFHLYAIGNSARNIASTLTQEEIDPPNEYYFKSIGKPNPYPDKTKSWGAATITVMLESMVYIGHLVQGKEQTLSHKLKQRI